MVTEIRDFEGTVADLSRFIVTTWRRHYGDAGFLLDWNADYFAWQLPGFGTSAACGAIAAYDGDRLIGVYPYEFTPIRLGRRDTAATMSSWISVDPDYLRAGIGRRLLEGIHARNGELGAEFNGGFVNQGRAVGKGRLFWQSAAPQSTVFDRPRLWGRVLDRRAVAQASWTITDRLSANFVGLLNAAHADSRIDGVRTFSPAEAAACHALFTRHMSHFDLAYRWDSGRLTQHLAFGSPATTLVLIEGSEVVAFACFHVLRAFGRAEVRIGILDVLCPMDLAVSLQKRLLRGVVAAMRRAGVGLAITLGPPMHRVSCLAACAFVPMLWTYSLLCAHSKRELSMIDVKRPYAHFR